MEVSRKITQSKNSDKISATLEVHNAVNGKMPPQGPLDGKAETIYNTTIAPSTTPEGKDAATQEVDQLIFFLDYYPDCIRFWVDERAIDDPEASKESIRKSKPHDIQHCSVIEVCIKAFGRPASCLNVSDENECDIYLPPSTHVMQVWVYRDPKKNRNKEGSKTTLDRPINSPASAKSAAQQRKLSVPAPTPLAIPERSTSLRHRPDSPIPGPVKIHKMVRHPDNPRKIGPRPGRPEPTTLQTLKDMQEPDGFRTNLLQDISRITSASGSYFHFRDDSSNSKEEDEDNGVDEDDDIFNLSPLDRALPLTPGQSLLVPPHHPSLGKAGQRARQSVFFDDDLETLPGDMKIEIRHVEMPEVTKEFAKPSKTTRLKTKLSMLFTRSRRR